MSIISLNLTMLGQTEASPGTLLRQEFRVPLARQVFSLLASQVSSVARLNKEKQDFTMPNPKVGPPTPPAFLDQMLLIRRDEQDVWHSRSMSDRKWMWSITFLRFPQRPVHLRALVREAPFDDSTSG